MNLHLVDWNFHAFIEIIKINNKLMTLFSFISNWQVSSMIRSSMIEWLQIIRWAEFYNTTALQLHDIGDLSFMKRAINSAIKHVTE